MKVLHLPTATGGNAYGLSRGERKLGLISDVLVVNNDFIQYPADTILFPKPARNIIEKLFIRPVLASNTIFKIRKQYDIFHFNFGTSLLDFPLVGLDLLDLPFYKNEGKVVVTFNGCDARQKVATMMRTSFSACHRDDCYNGICGKMGGFFDKLKRHKIKKFDQYAKEIFALNPDLLYFLPKRSKFLPYTIAGWDSIQALPLRFSGNTLRIMHAPTNRGAKGSDIILQALYRLKNNYPGRVDITLVENMPHSAALEVFMKADLIIDQILVGWYGALAVETMKMGKPVIAYIREEDLQFVPVKMANDCKQAILQADPTSLYQVLCEVLENPTLLKERADAGLDYVNKWHDPLFVAEITKKVYDG